MKVLNPTGMFVSLFQWPLVLLSSLVAVWQCGVRHVEMQLFPAPVTNAEQFINISYTLEAYLIRNCLLLRATPSRCHGFALLYRCLEEFWPVVVASIYLDHSDFGQGPQSSIKVDSLYSSAQS